MIEKLALIIIGAFIGALIQYYTQKNTKIFEQYQNKKETRYLAIILLLDGLVHFDSFKGITINRPDIKSKNDLFIELNVELKNMILFASESVISSVADCIKTPTTENFIKASVEMRKDLWHINTSKKLMNSLRDYLLK